MDESISLLEGVTGDVNEERIVWTLCEALVTIEPGDNFTATIQIVGEQYRIVAFVKN